MENEILLTLALTYAQGIGDITGKKLITHFGSAVNVFREIHSFSPSSGISLQLKKALSDETIIREARRELDYCREHNIHVSGYFDPDYPRRLKDCPDAPLILFKKGSAELEYPRIISVVGTRLSTSYGKDLVEELIAGLKPYNITIVSGLALGIDINAHKASLQAGLPTVAVVAHGLDTVYPASHKQYVHEILANSGAVVSDFPSRTKPDKENFPKRNRIIAGLSDAVVVVEARETGGALITADIANSYGREVFAYPGKITDHSSKGCLKLIRNNQAALITCAADLLKALRWDEETKKPVQTNLFIELNEDEKKLVELIRNVELADIDYLSINSGFNTGKIASTLLNLELSGVLRSLPGKVYKLKV